MLFVFTLFNLQGTPGSFGRFCSAFHRALTLCAELLYLSTSCLICQELFSWFFRLTALIVALSKSACIWYQLFPPLSTPFLRFFKVFSWPIFCGFFHWNTTTSCAVGPHPSTGNADAFGRIYNPPLQRAPHFFPLPYSLFPSPPRGSGVASGGKLSSQVQHFVDELHWR